MKCVCTIALAIWLLPVTAGVVALTRAESQGKENMISMNLCIPKGGVGIVNPHLYVDLTAANNELILDESRWIGKSRGVTELVVIVDDKVVSMASPPSEFTLARAVIVSFERDVVRFFDAQRWAGGYYKR